MNRQKRTRKHTFTLVELLVVLLILGVLVGLAVPRYMDVQKSARLHTFVSNIHEIESALETYRLSNSTGGNKYPDNLNALQNFFTQPPINPYTGKSMLSDNPEESGLRYENHDNDYTLCVTQLDVDDVNNNGNRNELIPVASHIGEACSVVTGGGITLDRTFISTTTITIDPTNGLDAFQTRCWTWDDVEWEGDVGIDCSNGNCYMSFPSDGSSFAGCEAYTLDTFMIGSNNADDSVIEFTVNIPEIGAEIPESWYTDGDWHPWPNIEIGLVGSYGWSDVFYLVWNGYDHTMYLVTHNGHQPLDGWYTGTHTFRFEFHHGKASIKVDNEVLWPESYFYGRSFNEDGAKFYVGNEYTNAAVQIGTIAITIDEYEFATTGTYISSIYDISTPNFITGTTDVVVSLHNFYDYYSLWPLKQYTDCTLEYQLSLDGGATWGDWQPVGSYQNMFRDSEWVQWGTEWWQMKLVVPSDFLRNISLENARIRLRVTLSTNNKKFSPEIEDVSFKIYNAQVTGTIEPYIQLYEPFLKDDPNKEFVNLVTLTEIYEHVLP